MVKKEMIIPLVIIILIAITIILISESKDHYSYCKEHYANNNDCLLSSRVYAGLVEPNSYLILNLLPLKTEIQDYINNEKINVSVYIENIRTGSSMGIRSNDNYEAASLNKLPIAMIIMKKIENGKLKLDTMLPISSEDRDSGSGELYNKQINELSVDKLLYYMLSESDNTAFHVLKKEISVEDIRKLSYYLDFFESDINLTSKSFNNIYTISPKSASNLFLSLYISTALNPKDSEKILKLLTNTSFDIKKYSGIPEGIVIAHKYGGIYNASVKQLHDCGIIYIQDSRFVYCIMTRNLENDKAIEVIGTIVKKTYDYIIEARKIKDIEI